MVLIVVWTLTTLAGPYLVKYGIDHGITEGNGAALDVAVVGYVIVAALSYVVYRSLITVLSKAGEGYLRDLRVKVFDHLQNLSMPFYDRSKAGVLVSRMTSDIDSISELVQTGLLMFLMNTLLLILSVVVLALVSWQLLLLCLVALPMVMHRQHQVPAGLQPGLPPGARPHRFHAVVPAGGHRRRPGHPGLRARGRRGRALRRRQPVALPGPHEVGVRAGLVPAGDRVRRARHHRPRRGRRRIDGDQRGGDASAPSPSSCSPSTTSSTRSSSSASSSTRCSRPAPASRSSTSSSTRRSTSTSGPTPSTCPATATSSSTAPRSATPAAPRCSPTCRSPSPWGSGWPSWARPAPASPPWPSSSPACTTRPTAGSPSAASTCATPRCRRCATAWSWCPRRASSSTAPSATTSGSARGDATDAEVDDALRTLGIYDRFAALPQGLDTEVRERGSRLQRGREAAGVDGPRRPGRPRPARARRGHLVARPRHRDAGREGDEHPDGGAHRRRHRPPPVHRRAGRPRRRRQRRLPRRDRHPRRPRRRRGPLRRPVQHLESATPRSRRLADHLRFLLFASATGVPVHAVPACAHASSAQATLAAGAWHSRGGWRCWTWGGIGGLASSSAGDAHRSARHRHLGTTLWRSAPGCVLLFASATGVPVHAVPACAHASSAQAALTARRAPAPAPRHHAPAIWLASRPRPSDRVATATSGLVEPPRAFVTIGVGEIPPGDLPGRLPPATGVATCPRTSVSTSASTSSAGATPRTTSSSPSAASNERHRQRDVVDEGRAGLDARRTA